VCNTLKNWIENYWFDFQDDKALLDKLIDFVEFVSKHNVKLVSVIKAPLTRKVSPSIVRLSGEKARLLPMKF
jgi:hypothetical protein